VEEKGLFAEHEEGKGECQSENNKKKIKERKIGYQYVKQEGFEKEDGPAVRKGGGER